VDDLQQLGFAQQFGLAGLALDAVESVLGGLGEQGITSGLSQPPGDADLLGRLPGPGGGLVRDTAALVFQATAADFDRAKDGLEGGGDAAPAAELPRVLAAQVAEQQLQVRLFEGLLEEQALQALAGVLDGALQGGG
jgi:hypothetical protein